MYRKFSVTIIEYFNPHKQPLISKNHKVLKPQMERAFMSESTNSKKVLTYRIPGEIKEKLGNGVEKIEYIKVVSFSDKLKTRGVYVCSGSNKVLEEVAPTPMQACGLITILNGKFVLIESDGETTLHFANAKSEDEVIDEVHMLSEKNGLADGISTYKKTIQKLELSGEEVMV